jgi:predicted PurR-regulated permease PerM
MYLVVVYGVLLIVLFICIVNSIYRKIEAKNPSEWKKVSIFNSYKAWTLYSFLIMLTMIGIFVFSFMGILTGFSNLGNQQNSITEQQQQQENTTTQQDDSSTQQQSNSTQK